MEMYVSGKWRNTNENMNVYYPYNGSIIDTVPVAGFEEIEDAIGSAERGAEVMADMPYWQRGQIIARASELLQERREEIAKIIVKENGKTINEARGEIGRSALTLTNAAEEASRMHGETLPLSALNLPNIEKKFGFSFRVPCGVVLAITPFNVPVNLACHKIGSAFAGGNAVILKPATDTPLSSMHLVQAFLDAGLPAEAIQCITGPGSRIGKMMASDKRIRKITFTGSFEVGQEICKMAGLKKVTMELGGNCPTIVMQDADPEKVASALVPAGYGLSGQACISTQRAFVHESLYEEIINRLKEKLNDFVLGDPMSENTTMGPLIRESDAIRVEKSIKDAREKGARIIRGGTRTGNFIEPAIVADVTKEMTIYKDEIFGPAIGFIKFDTFEEAIEGANDTNYGLSSGIFTENLNTAMQFIRRIKTGNTMVNWPSRWRADHMPSGGIKDSGLGKEGPRYAIEELTELRTAILHLDDKSPF